MAERQVRIREALPGETPHFVANESTIFRGLAIACDQMCVAGELQPGDRLVLGPPYDLTMGVGYVLEPVESDPIPDHIREG